MILKIAAGVIIANGVATFNAVLARDMGKAGLAIGVIVEGSIVCLAYWLG
jgi:hypothetical protein